MDTWETPASGPAGGPDDGSQGDAWMSLGNTEQADERVFQFPPFLRATKTTPP